MQDAAIRPNVRNPGTRLNRFKPSPAWPRVGLSFSLLYIFQSKSRQDADRTTFPLSARLIIRSRTSFKVLGNMAQEAFITGVEAAQALSSYIKGKIGMSIAYHSLSLLITPLVLVTGCTLGGLGTEFAKTIVKHDPKLVILTARTQAKYVVFFSLAGTFTLTITDRLRIDETLASVRQESPNAPLRSVILDLSLMDDVRRAAAEINAYPEIIDVCPSHIHPHIRSHLVYDYDID